RNFPLVSMMTPEQLGERGGDFCLFSVHHRPLGFAHIDSAARRRSHAAAGEMPSARPAVLGPGDSQVAADFAAAVKARMPVLHRVRLRNGGNILRYDRLALPLSDDGVEIDYLLTFAKPHGWDAMLLGLPAGRAAHDLAPWPPARAPSDPVEPRIA